MSRLSYLVGLAGLAGLAGLVGCAAATQDTPVDGRPIEPPIDAPDIDALPTMTLSQTANMTIGIGQTLACSVNMMPVTRENSWYRVFPLTAAGITGAFQVTQIAFGVESAGPDAQVVEVRLGTYAGTPGPTLDTTLITQLETMMVTVPASTTPQFRSTPMTTSVPAGSNLVVEIFAPDGQPLGLKFYAGSTAGAETAPGYLRGPDCGITAPRSMKVVATEAMRSAGSLIIEVTGTY